jgi:DedD protein
MDHRLKERLTGATILVALIVLLVPEMFHGQSGDTASSVGSGGEGPPLRSYTIDLSNAVRTAPLQSTPSANSIATPEQPTAESPPARSAATGASSAATVNTETSSAGVAPPMSTAVASTGALSVPVPTNGAAMTSARPKPAERAALPGWSVQLGLFSQRDNAQRLVHAAQAKGFAVSLADPDGKGPYRVRVAGLADHAAAQAVQQRLRTQGFPAAIVAP